MKFRLFIGLAAASMALSACQGQRPGYLYDFKPYIQNEQHALPQAYPDQLWAYPEGTPPEQIVAGWKTAQLVTDVYEYKGATRVDVGPQFYNLPASGQRGLANAVSRMYRTNNFLLMDRYRERPVGIYTPTGLHMY